MSLFGVNFHDIKSVNHEWKRIPGLGQCRTLHIIEKDGEQHFYTMNLAEIEALVASFEAWTKIMKEHKRKERKEEEKKIMYDFEKIVRRINRIEEKACVTITDLEEDEFHWQVKTKEYA